MLKLNLDYFLILLLGFIIGCIASKRERWSRGKRLNRSVDKL